ncbi:MAG: hypothetical protein VW778_04815 [Betaproteobacteria bacterium]|jgi:hypothetical protein
MQFVDLIFIVGLFLLGIGLYSAFYLLRLSVTKSKDELKDINVANLWVLFAVGVTLGLVLVYFWFD